MKALLALPFVVLLAGCGLTPEGDAARAAIAEKGAQVYDEGLANAEWFLCNAASVGSVRRRYGTSADRAALYRSLCNQGTAGNVIGDGRPDAR